MIAAVRTRQIDATMAITSMARPLDVVRCSGVKAGADPAEIIDTRFLPVLP